jgi:hypothetical protein
MSLHQFTVLNFLIALSGTVSCAAMEVEKLLDGTVRVFETESRHPAPISGKERPLGTAFVVENGERCILATAAHILNGVGTDRIAIKFRFPLKMPAARTRAAHIFRDKDMAFLESDARACANLSTFSLMPSFTVLVGDDVVLIGYPAFTGGQPSDPIIRSGIVASTSLKVGSPTGGSAILLDLIGVNGYSGSPVVRKGDGLVIGVHNGVAGPRGITGHGFSAATPLTQIDLSILPRTPK